MNFVPVRAKTHRGEDCIINAATVATLTTIGAKSNPQCQIVFTSGHTMAFAGTAEDHVAAIQAAQSGQPATVQNDKIPPDLRTR